MSVTANRVKQKQQQKTIQQEEDDDRYECFSENDSDVIWEIPKKQFDAIIENKDGMYQEAYHETIQLGSHLKKVNEIKDILETTAQKQEMEINNLKLIISNREKELEI